MKPLDDILPGIMPYAPGCAAPTAYFAIRQAAIEFCERTRLWRYEDEFAVNAAIDEPIMAPSGAVIHEIEAVRFDGDELCPQTVAWLDQHCAGWRASDYSGTPSYVTQTDPNTIRIVPLGTGTVSVSLWLKPAQDADELPDFLVDQYREVIAHGALVRILSIPNQSFSDPNMAIMFGQGFQGRLDSLSAKGFTGQQRAPMRTRGSFL